MLKMCLATATIMLMAPAYADSLPPLGSCENIVGSLAIVEYAARSCGFAHAAPSPAALACKTRMSDSDWRHWSAFGVSVYNRTEQKIGHTAACARVTKSINESAHVPQIDQRRAEWERWHQDACWNWAQETIAQFGLEGRSCDLFCEERIRSNCR